MTPVSGQPGRDERVGHGGVAVTDEQGTLKGLPVAYTLIGAVLTVLGNLVADIALAVADPRIRLG